MENESNKMTAVQWLLDEMKIARILCDDSNMEMDIFHTLDVLIKKGEQAQQIEKQQMWEYINKNYCIGPKSLEFHRLEFEQYYAEKYGKKTFLDLVSDEESQVHEVVKKLKENKIQGGNK
jgi:hypothetical protein